MHSKDMASPKGGELLRATDRLGLSHKRLVALLDYDPETGVFRWKQRKGGGKPGSRAGTVKSDGYRRLRLDGHEYAEHRLAWFYVRGRWPAGMLDHRDTDQLNNRLRNLREATCSQNAANRGAQLNNKSCGLKGATIHKKTGRWQAHINVRGRYHYLGLHDTPLEAHAAYAAAAVEALGEFARLA